MEWLWFVPSDAVSAMVPASETGIANVTTNVPVESAFPGGVVVITSPSLVIVIFDNGIKLNPCIEITDPEEPLDCETNIADDTLKNAAEPVPKALSVTVTSTLPVADAGTLNLAATVPVAVVVWDIGVTSVAP